MGKKKGVPDVSQYIKKKRHFRAHTMNDESFPSIQSFKKPHVLTKNHHPFPPKTTPRFNIGQQALTSINIVTNNIGSTIC